MTKKEWKDLCREAKNDNTYYKLVFAVNDYITEQKRESLQLYYCATDYCVTDFISEFSKNVVKSWYNDYCNNHY